MNSKKIFSGLLILMLIFIMPVVYAHDVTLAEEGMIVIPDKISATTKIEVDESFGDYKLYYQWVSMNYEDYESYLEFLEYQKDYMENENPGASATDEEKQEFEETLLEYENSKRELKPAYVESDWEESYDGTVPFNLNPEGVEEGDPYVLWIKVESLDDSDNVIYNERLIEYEIPEDLEQEVESPETADNILVIGVLTLTAVGLMTFSYKKSKA